MVCVLFKRGTWVPIEDIMSTLGSKNMANVYISTLSTCKWRVENTSLSVWHGHANNAITDQGISVPVYEVLNECYPYRLGIGVTHYYSQGCIPYSLIILLYRIMGAL